MKIDLLFGVFAVAFGLYTFYLRYTSPQKLEKFEAMKERWGERTGTILHTLSYSLAPTAIGLLLIARSLLRSASPQ